MRTDLQDRGNPPPRERNLVATSYVAYRVILAIGLLLLNMMPEARLALEIPQSENFLLIAGIYFATAVMAGLIHVYIDMSTETAARLALWSDILLLPLLMLVAGSLAFSLGLMLAVSFALGNSLIPRGALLRATAASVLVVAALLLSEYVTGEHFSEYSNALLLVFSFYAIGLLASYLERKLKTTQVLVDRQLVDIRNLTEVNAYIVQQLPSGALVVDSLGRLQTGNTAAWQLLGIDETGSGTLLVDIAPELDRALKRWSEKQQASDDARQPGTYIDQEQQYEASFSTFGNDSSNGILITLSDLRKVSDRAREMKLASLGQLVGSVAHEIRNPLNAIQQSAQLLEESPELDESDRQLTQIIDKQSRRLNRLVTDILDVSRSNCNTPIDIELDDWLREFVDHYQLSLEETQADIHFEAAPVDMRILFDPDQLQQILWNLLNNAKKHSRPQHGDVDIRLVCKPVDDGSAILIMVCDNGAALDISEEERLFDPFYSTEHSGVGLGLFIAHELSLNNSARLEYRREGNQNCFRLRCPTAGDRK